MQFNIHEINTSALLSKYFYEPPLTPLLTQTVPSATYAPVLPEIALDTVTTDNTTDNTTTTTTTNTTTNTTDTTNEVRENQLEEKPTFVNKKRRVVSQSSESKAQTSYRIIKLSKLSEQPSISRPSVKRPYVPNENPTPAKINFIPPALVTNKTKPKEPIILQRATPALPVFVVTEALSQQVSQIDNLSDADVDIIIEDSHENECGEQDKVDRTPVAVAEGGVRRRLKEINNKTIAENQCMVTSANDAANRTLNEAQRALENRRKSLLRRTRK